MYGNSYMQNPQQADKIVFEGECSCKHRGQMWGSSRYIVFVSNGDFKMYNKESDFRSGAEPHRLIKAGDDVEGDVQQDGKHITMNVPNISKEYIMTLSNDGDAQYWKDLLTEVIQKKRMDKMTGMSRPMGGMGGGMGVSPSMSYSAVPPGGVGAKPGVVSAVPPPSSIYGGGATSYNTMAAPIAVAGGLALGGGIAYNTLAPPNVSYMTDARPLTATTSGGGGGMSVPNSVTQGFNSAVNQTSQMANQVGGQIYSGVNQGMHQAGNAINNVNMPNMGNVGNQIYAGANQGMNVAGNVGGQIYSGVNSGINQAGNAINNVNMPNMGNVGGQIYSGVNQGMHQAGNAINNVNMPNMGNVGGQMYAGVNSGINQAGNAINNVNMPNMPNMGNVGGQIYSGVNSGIHQAGNAIGNINVPSIGGGGGGGNGPQMYVPTFNSGSYSQYGSQIGGGVSTAWNQTSSYAGNVGGQMYSAGSSALHQTTNAMGNINIGGSMNVVTTALATAGGAVIGALTSDTTMKMLRGLGELATNIPLLGVIGVSMKLFFDAAALAKYNKKAAEALSARVREVGDILNELCSTVTNPSATMNTQLQNLDGLINEISKFLEKFAQKSYLSRLFTGSGDEAAIKNFDKQLLDLIQLVQLTIGTKTIQLQQRTLQGMDDMSKLIKDTMNSKRAPGDSDETVMGKLSQEDIDKIAKAVGVTNADLQSEISAKLDEIAASQKRMESSIDKLVAMNGGSDNLSLANEKAKRFWDEYFQAKTVSYETFLEGFEEEFNKGNPLSSRGRDKVIRSIDIPNASGHGDGNISYIEWKRFFRSIFADSHQDFSTTFDVVGYVESKLK